MHAKFAKSYVIFVVLSFFYATACLAETPLLPLRTQDDKDLYAWLQTFEERDFDVPRLAITYESGIATAEDLYG